MYLQELHIKNFRAIKDTKIKFNKGLNILIGPNNSGKTTIIDALRICLSKGDYNSKNVKLEDFYKVTKKSKENYPTVEFNLTFCIEKEFEKALFIELYNPKNNTLDINFTFKYNLKQQRINHEIKGGEKRDNSISNESFSFIKNIYLSALRDANRYLTPGRDNILSSFFSKLISDDDKEEMMDEINNNINESQISEFIAKSNKEYIQNHFDMMKLENEEMNLSMSPLDQDFDNFTKNWKIQLPFGNSDYLELYQNGLGYNNLIYISVLLSHLDMLKKDSEENAYLSLCIEEPEAHLHPQLQNSFFRHLNEINSLTNIQLFITSHSPTLTSKADLKSLILIQNTGNNVVSHNIVNSFPEVDDQNFLKKFLDVTKSQLLFSKKVIFVEGISEAILVPVFAKICGFDLDKHGVEVVNVQGLSFKRFAPLFDDENDLTIKGVILTDDDRSSICGNGSDSYNKIKMLETNKLKIFSSRKTFEFELIYTNGFESEIWEIFKNKHSGIFEGIDDFTPLFNVFNNSQKNSIKKADIALTLSEEIKKESEDIVPEYIKKAFDFLRG